ncbi:hypothetical protein E3N88_25876 [Mikania micrantha]|uniref:Uncharacterized protein n=1 Tax=Mikania micrantha TaxID=192012 RepID=A0A5N6N6H9_9ASTR|nr:hypothetical protein E3N88_25876 [Mikania micrantha]
MVTRMPVVTILIDEELNPTSLFHVKLLLIKYMLPWNRRKIRHLRQPLKPNPNFCPNQEHQLEKRCQQRLGFHRLPPLYVEWWRINGGGGARCRPVTRGRGWRAVTGGREVEGGDGSVGAGGSNVMAVEETYEAFF